MHSHSEKSRLNAAKDKLELWLQEYVQTNYKAKKEISVAKIVEKLKSDLDEFLHSKSKVISLSASNFIAEMCDTAACNIAPQADFAVHKAANAAQRANRATNLIAASIANPDKSKAELITMVEALDASNIDSQIPTAPKKKKKKNKSTNTIEDNSDEQESKKSLSTSNILAVLREAPAASTTNEADPLIVSSDHVPELKMPSNIKKLIDMPRDAQFWECIHEGFLNGSGKSFLTTLQGYGVFQALFPPASEDAKIINEKNDAWFKARLHLMDSIHVNNQPSYERSAQSFNPHTLAAMLIVKDLPSNPSEEDKRNMYMAYEAYNIPFSYDKLKPHINYFCDRKSEFLRGAEYTVYKHFNVEEYDPDADNGPVFPASMRKRS